MNPEREQLRKAIRTLVEQETIFIIHECENERQLRAYISEFRDSIQRVITDTLVRLTK